MAAAVNRVTSSLSTLGLSSCRVCEKQLSGDQVKRCMKCREAIYCGKECQTGDWKTHKVVCKTSLDVTKPNIEEAVCKTPLDLTKPFTEANQKLRSFFSDFNALLALADVPKKLAYMKTAEYNHILQTQKMILEGSTHLDPEKSIVVVCGAQFYNRKFVEPLPQLLEKCKKLILVDVDPVTLNHLHALLGKSPKVSLVTVDLSCSLKSVADFEKASANWDQAKFSTEIANFLERMGIIASQRAPGLSGVLAEGEVADYVISSLVASELSSMLKESLFSLFDKKFGTTQGPSRSLYTLKQLRSNAHMLAAKHAEDLCAWAGKTGRVYLADKCVLQRGDVTGVMVEQRTLDLYKNMLQARSPSQLVMRQWHWEPYVNENYTVAAALI